MAEVCIFKNSLVGYVLDGNGQLCMDGGVVANTKDQIGHRILFRFVENIRHSSFMMQLVGQYCMCVLWKEGSAQHGILEQIAKHASLTLAK